MFRILKFITCSMLLSSTLAVAQVRPIEVKITPAAGGYSLDAENNTTAMPHSVAIIFSRRENLMIEKISYHTVTFPKRLLSLKPTNPEERCDFRFGYLYLPGDYQAKPVTDFVYRLPYSVNKNRLSLEMYHLPSAISADKKIPQGWRPLQFIMEEGDTVYAARRGMVVDIVDEHDTKLAQESHSSYNARSNKVCVEHADGTIAEYGNIARGTIQVQIGDKVYPDTPLALAGSVKEGKFEVTFMIYYTKLNPQFKQDTKNEFPFEHAYVNPIFATTVGDVILESSQKYQPLVDEELLQKEITRKELAKLKKKK